MANYPKYTLTGKTPAATYESLVQYNVESASLVNGDGNDLPQLNITASIAVSASWAPQTLVTTVNSASWSSSSLSSSNALGIDAGSDIFIHSHQGSIGVLATTDVFLSATGSMYMEAAGGNIEMTPRSAVSIDGDLSVAGHVYSPMILSGSDSPTIAFLSANGFNQGEVHGFLGFNGRFWSGTTAFSETARIEGVKDAPDGQTGGALIFFTADAGNNIQERARIDRNGNLSVTGSIATTSGFIGTSSYAAALTDGNGLTTTVYLTASVTTMSFVNGLLQSVS